MKKTVVKAEPDVKSGPKVLVEVTAYKGYLILRAVMEDPSMKTDEWVPYDGANTIGCVVLNSKKNVGISDEALKLLRMVKKSRDDIGDVDWWKCNNGPCAFSWLGGWKAVKRADDGNLEGSRNYRVFDGEFQSIPNNIDLEAKAFIDKKGK